MERVVVQSSRVKSVGWADGVLEVEFPLYTRKRDGVTPPNVLRYSPIAREFYERFFVEGSSAGKLVNDLRFDAAVTCVPVESDSAEGAV